MFINSLDTNTFGNCFQSALVYQLQRRVRTLRDQLQRRDLHLDLLRRKISVQDESTKMRTLLETERDDSNIRYYEIIFKQK